MCRHICPISIGSKWPWPNSKPPFETAATIEGLDNAVALALPACTDQECLNFFAAAAFDLV
jgi:hypothetical protein